jgi:uroporphyrinogen-III synthase
LGQAGVNCIDSVLYRAVKTGEIPENVWAAMERGEAQCSVFYSQRTAENFIRIVQDKGRTDLLKSIMALCLSDSVVQSARQELWKHTRIAAQPRDGEVLRLLEECMSSQ